MKRSLLAIVFSLGITLNLTAQQTQMYIPRNIEKAYDKQTRSMDGRPGKNYWQNRSSYQINLQVFPPNQQIRGDETVTYYNNSPDTLVHIVIRAYQDIYKPGNTRRGTVDPADEAIGGLNIETLSFNDQTMDPKKGIQPGGGTNLIYTLPVKLAPGQSVTMKAKWNYNLNLKTKNREGAFDSTTYFVAYFYPQIAVYDDIDGWDQHSFTFDQEFYNDMNDYDVSISVPQNYLVWATGDLQNPSDVLSPKILKRYQTAQNADTIVEVVTPKDLTERNTTTHNDFNTWKFSYNHVSDFAFALSNHYVWEATSLVADQKTGRRVSINTAYKESSVHFQGVLGIAIKAIDYYCHQIPGVPFPFPKETVFNAFDQMEYPMMVNDVDDEDFQDDVDLTSHEIGHSYFPFYMGFNEEKYAFMDEGWATYLAYEVSSKAFEMKDAFVFGKDYYESVAGYENELPPLIPSNFDVGNANFTANYPRPALAYANLQDLLGDELFKKCLQEFMTRWNGKHPLPYDFFNTFNDVSKQNLDWFFKPWFSDYGFADLTVWDVSKTKSGYSVKVENKGNIPVGIHLLVTYSDATTDTVNTTCSVWNQPLTQYTLPVATKKTITKVELADDKITPDSDNTNNSWEAK